VRDAPPAPAPALLNQSFVDVVFCRPTLAAAGWLLAHELGRRETTEGSVGTAGLLCSAKTVYAFAVFPFTWSRRRAPTSVVARQLRVAIGPV
jgi:hypothetical protein